MLVGLPVGAYELAPILIRARRKAASVFVFSGKRNLHTVGGTLGSGPLTATASHTDTVDNIALLGLVAETTSLVGARGAGSTVDSVQLTELY